MKKVKGFSVIESLITLAFAATVLCMVAVGPVMSYSSVEHSQITVKDKERVCEGGKVSECRYLVFTDQGVYENTDSFLHFKFGSSDVHNDLEVGKTYNVKTNWYRVPFFSMYQNILEIRGEVK